MKIELKKIKKKGQGLHETFHCPVRDCFFHDTSAPAFYDHLKLVHEFYYFGEKHARS